MQNLDLSEHFPINYPKLKGFHLFKLQYTKNILW